LGALSVLEEEYQEYEQCDSHQSIDGLGFFIRTLVGGVQEYGRLGRQIDGLEGEEEKE
jgi:hypothetical protein